MTTTDRIDQMECPECLGAGHDGDRQCPTCDGRGRAPLGAAKHFLQQAHAGAAPTWRLRRSA
jgi:DnaJ-class molecular chaperone